MAASLAQRPLKKKHKVSHLSLCINPDDCRRSGICELTAISVLAADTTSNAGSLAVAVLAVDDASTGVELSTSLNGLLTITSHELVLGSRGGHGQSKEEDDGGDEAGGLHFGGVVCGSLKKLKCIE